MKSTIQTLLFSVGLAALGAVAACSSSSGDNTADDGGGGQDATGGSSGTGSSSSSGSSSWYVVEQWLEQRDLQLVIGRVVVGRLVLGGFVFGRLFLGCVLFGWVLLGELLGRLVVGGVIVRRFQQRRVVERRLGRRGWRGRDARATLLTVDNFDTWCSVTVNGSTASTAASQTVCVVTSSTVTLTAEPNGSAFELGTTPWHKVTGDTGSGVQGNVAGTGATAVSTVTVVAAGATQCVYACCPFTSGTGCCGAGFTAPCL